MSSLIVLCALLVAFFIARRWWLERHEQRLRENPPQRQGIEVALPNGSEGSPRAFASFLRKVASSAMADAKTRRAGQRQLDIVYLASAPSPGAEPVIRFRIYADPDRMDAIKRAIKQVYKGTCEVNPIKEDELLELAQRLRPQPEAEPEHADAPEATAPGKPPAEEVPA